MTDIKQVGGNHYAVFPYQIADFLVDIRARWVQGDILVYICRAKYKNGAEDVDKALSLLPLLERERAMEKKQKVPDLTVHAKKCIVRFNEMNKDVLSDVAMKIASRLATGEDTAILSEWMKQYRDELG